jgi:hypothetical protein
MHRKFLCGLAIVLWAPGIGAQSVPARDLWEFPLGSVLEPAGLASEPGAGLWNPATTFLPPDVRWRLGVVSLTSSADQSVDGQVMSLSFRRDAGTTIGVSVARATIASILRTETDPIALGEVPYSSLMVSAMATKAVFPHVNAGIAIRYREGRSDQLVNNAMAADIGVVVHSLPVRDARIAVSSFLWRPGREIQDRPAIIVAADARVMGETDRETRIGVSYNGVNRGAKEYGPFVSWRFDRVDLRSSYLRTAASGRTVSRLRSGVALHYTRYVVGVAREEGASGLGPLYQITLSSLFR